MESGLFPLQLQIHSCGVHYKHPPDFVVDRPNGSGDWVWVQFLSPVHLRDKNGFHRLPAAAHILHSPDFPHWYGGIENPMEAHWMHLGGNDTKTLVQQCELETDCAFLLEPSPILTRLLKSIEREWSRKELFQNQVSTLLAAQFLFELGRCKKNQNQSRFTRHQAALREVLQDVRLKMLREPQTSRTVQTMAMQSHLSASRFASLYREFFGVTPMEDVLRARIERTCWLLTNTDAVVSRVAEECGFASTAHFSRTFTRRMGCTPSRYAR